jgi:HPt (histidine-containing phosphotransfer) domain-containing protein
LARKAELEVEMAENVVNGANGAVYINVDEAIKRVMNNGKLFARLLTKFKTENTSLLDDAINFVHAGDYEKAKVSIHTLKGIAANLALTELYKQTVELEKEIKGCAVKADTRESVQKCLGETLVLIDGVIAHYGS